MIPELGHFALILALLLAVVLGTLPLAGLHAGVPAWVALARPAALAQGLFVLFAWACLVAAFVANDFSVRNVAENSNTLLPLPYRVAASWGSHEGSMLLWVLMHALWTLAVAARSRALPPALAVRALAVAGWVSAAFLLFVLFTSNPFLRAVPVPLEGRDLNPLLQDPGMVLHPPLLYMGYVGFGVAFAFALAALMGGTSDTLWARWCRPWTLLAWCFLTAGVALGSWWAYTELGWGGWWFWDPVENAAFMPWLVGTALVHALAVAAQRGRLQAWAVLLAILCFSLSLLGTFLVRSGVLSSVHAFAIDPRRGLFILSLLVLVIGGSLALFALRAPRLVSRAPLRLLSREGLLLHNNLLLLVAAATVLLGTLYPLAMDVLGLGRISVGAPYFDAVFAPLMVPLLLMMGVGPFMRWQAALAPGSLPSGQLPLGLWRRLAPALAASVVGGLVLPWAWGTWDALVALGLALALWPALAMATLVIERARGAGGWPAMRRQPLAWWGMNLAHLGVAVFLVGVTLVRSLQTEIDLRMAPGETLAIGSHLLAFGGVTEVPGPNYSAERGRFDVTRDGRSVGALWPEKRRYTSLPGTPMTEAAISSGLTGDLYVALGEPLGAGAWTVRAYHKPFVGWIWAGCALMALGGLLSVAGRRARIAVAATEFPGPRAPV